jgi:hypothetical protein
LTIALFLATVVSASLPKSFSLTFHEGRMLPPSCNVTT